MSETSLNRLRQKFWLSPLPDSISVPAIGDHIAAAVRPIDEASVDDVAFAIHGLNQQMSALSGQMEALKKLHITWQPQMEGGKAARELPGIVDQVLTLSLFDRDGDTWRHNPDSGAERRFVCRAGNPFALPAKDRSGRLDITDPPDLGALLTKINRL